MSRDSAKSLASGNTEARISLHFLSSHCGSEIVLLEELEIASLQVSSGISEHSFPKTSKDDSDPRMPKGGQSFVGSGA